MKWNQILKCTLLANVARSAAFSQEVEEQTPKIVKLSFDKRHGENYEESLLGKRDALPFVKRDDGEYELSLRNRQNFYSVDLEVGSPSQKITVLLDTGSSDLWITGSDNPYCKSNSHSSKKRDIGDNSLDDIFSDITAGGSGAIYKTLTLTGGSMPSSFGSFGSIDVSTGGIEPTETISGGGGGSGGSPTGSSSSGGQSIDCSRYGTFDKNQSSTYKSNNTAFEISYGDGSFASGEWGRDHIELGSLNISDVSMAVANDTNSTVGVLGIGLPGLETTYSSDQSMVSGDRHMYSNFPMVLKERGITKKNVYSLYLNSPDAHNGSILFGAVDKSKFDGSLYTIPILNVYKSRGVSQPIQFDVTLQGLGLSNQTSTTTLSTTKIPALLDSGSTLAYLPEDLLEMVADGLGARFSENLNYYLMDCPSKHDETKIVFNFGGFNIETNLTTYTTPISSDTCVLRILPSGDSSAILGDAFLVHAYVVYDLEDFEISMAQANFDVNHEDIEVVSSSIPQATAAAGYSSTYSSSKSITSGGNIFSSGTLSGSASNTASGNNKSKNMAAAPVQIAPTSLLATIFFAISMFF
ncbi:hypothetical protein ZYGR_0U00670 [Zygosaccharomyces rouxii]|uniref:ZYRO0F10230p n=2 Tax=Zygosaccharomyces rouxii TaxID=4956 RepID=C5DY48_ZYGRC|nr:uncharacterized protein ZYRO0F10230g [Zygosaccharomyces rouxii]KAH9199467.1 aspartic peptidase domain-containing protein [Zygosaccharomyces rouxii]GAV50211.1 hypothetical protein ZYGR_0U00670 [Zygosaccharomyces rouxii]CAR28709.1 ZYRO0F10230p [Zygosaccharomyces rouxii]